ncbi:MAG TPA: adenylate/guanylate cyclase domain-containing protein, partial [Saprospiraceae bacterium]|nr:adenylate/guanylate cyclase domain-containing protein [Saprospiraceae bacterium]
EAELNKQKKIVEGLNADQVRSELLLSRQKSVLDSMIYTSVLDSVKLATQEATMSQQSTQLALQQSQRNLAFAGGGLVALLALGLFFRFKSEKKYSNTLHEKNIVIEKERAKSESLLLNILPKSIAEELKLHGVAKTRNYENVTVLFTDFVNFTAISEKLTPEELVQNLDLCFKHFDSIVRKYGIEKIKTIGDSYMAAGGIPDKDKGHPLKMIQAAKEMVSFLEEWKAEKIKENKPYFEARIGLHSGPVTAGIVGMDKFAYDIWGDTVNVASRSESSSIAGKINISESLYDLVKGDVNCTSRGKIAAKNKGEIEMYFVD